MAEGSPGDGHGDTEYGGGKNESREQKCRKGGSGPHSATFCLVTLGKPLTPSGSWLICKGETASHDGEDPM